MVTAMLQHSPRCSSPLCPCPSLTRFTALPALRCSAFCRQKKRVTTGEMAVGPIRALFADEISTGLDSNTTFQARRQCCSVLSAAAPAALLEEAVAGSEL